jgi:hypothetical protein
MDDQSEKGKAVASNFLRFVAPPGSYSISNAYSLAS